MKETKRPIYLFSPTAIEDKEIVHMPLIAFQTVTEKIDTDNVDILLFTSKEAVKRAYAIDAKIRRLPTIAISKKTQAQIEQLGGTVIALSPSSSAEGLIELIKDRFRDKTILYLRPKVVATDIVTHLKEVSIAIKEQIIYETIAKHYPSSKKPLPHSVLLFTSPLTVKTFVEQFGWDESYVAVAIGPTTYRSLPSQQHCYMPKEPAIDAMVSLAKRLA